MKKYFSLLLALLMLAMSLPVSAANTAIIRETDVIYTESGDIEVETILTIHDSSYASGSKTATKDQTFKRDGIIIADVSFSATFRYTGTSVSITDTDSSYDTYDGWSYKNESISTSGGTAKLSAKLTKLLNSSVPVSISIKCTADGVIS